MVKFVDVAIFDEIAVTFVATIAGMVLDTVNSLKLMETNQTLYDQILLCATFSLNFLYEYKLMNSMSFNELHAFTQSNRMLQTFDVSFLSKLLHYNYANCILRLCD